MYLYLYGYIVHITYTFIMNQSTLTHTFGIGIQNKLTLCGKTINKHKFTNDYKVCEYTKPIVHGDMRQKPKYAGKQMHLI